MLFIIKVYNILMQLKKNKNRARNVIKKNIRKKKNSIKDGCFLKPAISVDEIKSLSWNTPNLFINPKDDEEKRILIFTPTTGLVRMEWVQARYSQMIPTNWSFVDMQHYLSPRIAVGYQLADAQNLMAKELVEGDYKWVIYIEHDNVIPPDGFLRFNQYINDHNVPVVSGLYFLKSHFTEPLIYRGRGTSHFKDWKLGDRVWCDGAPFGFRLENAGLIKAAWKTSEEIIVGGVKTRRVFSQPRSIYYDKEAGIVIDKGGTSDLEWCTRIIEEKLLEKAGFPEYQKKKYPFLVDTNIFVKHIDQDGMMWPQSIPARYVSEDKNYKGKEVN